MYKLHEGKQQRILQDKYDSRDTADFVANLQRDEISKEDQLFIEGRDMFFLSTVDEEGRPTVSYKGGDPGFVKVVNKNTIAFPDYDGNGMFYSLGNIASSAYVGMLFINFEKPERLRVQGTATVSDDDPLIDEYKEVKFMVRVKVDAVWINCPRYVHRMQKVKESRYVPREDSQTPLAGWKRIDIVQGVLPARDKGRAEKEGGTITVEEWFAMIAKGDPKV
ncbi:MAG TPA: pyridoxamine 5'-phosphate oxidase [Rhodospirillaceae bacterium]|nr:pyridoxamine 5'-phosphate oxidase family protein [Alphaproteobacteria bacterium]HAQ32843.1 pyridoxamine 5'-phosphate oxidase [Rhodospirillaceae bacterium]